MSNNLEWLDRIEFEDLLTSDMKLIAERCGIDVLKSLLANLPKLHIYMSERPLVEAQKRYIDRFYRQGNAKEIAANLGVSERFVYQVHRELIRRRHQLKKEKNLFNQE